MKPLKRCPECECKDITMQDDPSNAFYNCPACGLEFWQNPENGKVFIVNDDGLVYHDENGNILNEEIKSKAFIFRETGLSLSLF
jgi:hypothetical protein